MPASPQPPPPDAPATVRLGYALRQRRQAMPGIRNREQLAERLGYSVAVIKDVENGVYRAGLHRYLTRWEEAFGADEEIQHLWDQVRADEATWRRPGDLPPPRRQQARAEEEARRQQAANAAWSTHLRTQIPTPASASAQTNTPASDLSHPASLVATWQLRDGVWMDRRSILQLLGLLGTDAGLTISTIRPPSSGATAPDTTMDMEAVSARYRSLYYRVDPRQLLPPVIAAVGLHDQSLHNAPAGPLRQRLSASTALTALLAGRIVDFDLGDTTGARQHYSLALDAAHESGDPAIAAAVLGHLSFPAAAEHKPYAAAEHLDHARHLAARAEQSATLLSWLGAVEAEVWASVGEADRALRALDRAHTELADQHRGQEQPPWLDWFSPARMKGFAGQVYLRAHRWPAAIADLQGALAAEPAHSKQRSVFLADLGTVFLRSGDLDQACRMAGEALDAAVLGGYATGIRRVQALHAEACASPTAPAVLRLTERLRITGAWDG